MGYSGGFTKNANYEEICSGDTGHAEVVRVIYDPAKVTLGELLKVFWENHDPTQLMRQGPDIGTQYRSCIFYQTDAQHVTVKDSLSCYQAAIKDQGYGDIVTEVSSAGEFYYAEDHHQQYLHKVPNGYCGMRGLGVPGESCPTGIGVNHWGAGASGKKGDKHEL